MRSSWFLVAAALSALPGCSNRNAVERAERFSAAVCACGEVECARNALHEFESWFQDNTPRGTREDAEAITSAYRKAQSCKKEREEMQP
jgi:hypothetical protein